MLLFALVVGATLIALPDAAVVWIMRVLLIVGVVVLLVYIRSMRRVRDVIIWRSPLKTPTGALTGLAVLSVWIWYLVRGFLAGKWIDASIISVLVAEAASYIMWFKARYGRAG
jgi:hypothetical protein